MRLDGLIGCERTEQPVAQSSSGHWRAATAALCVFVTAMFDAVGRSSLIDHYAVLLTRQRVSSVHIAGQAGASTQQSIRSDTVATNH